jgi:phosphoribosylamine--glycine ligase
MQRFLVIGTGGREHALCWRLAQEVGKENVYACPGNDGMADVAQLVQLDIYNYAELTAFIKKRAIQYVVVGPEEPLVRGWRNEMEKHLGEWEGGIIGPSVTASLLEGSKAWARDFCLRHHIPIPAYKTFHIEQYEDIMKFLENNTAPYVIKADGLAAGKGVVISQTLEEAKEHVNKIAKDRIYGKAGEKLVIEQFLKGVEVSFFIVTDGKSYVLLPEAKDYKRVYDHDLGPNTGGMGSISPVPFVDEALKQKICKRIIEPTLDGLRKEQIAYHGFLFFGLMIVQGDPYLIEYNVRLGDPETQSILPRIKSSFVELIERVARGALHGYRMEIAPSYVATVILASKGYPDKYEVGFPIFIHQKVNEEKIHFFYAGVKQKGSELVTSGGRVLAVVGEGHTLQEALHLAYQQASFIHFEGVHYRKDIGKDVENLNLQ